MSITIQKEIHADDEAQLFKLLYDAFKSNMSIFFKNREVARRLLSKSINYKLGFYAFNENNKLVGIIGAEHKNQNFLTFSFSTLRSEYNFFKSLFLYILLKVEPEVIKNEKEVSIKVIAVDNENRSKGIGKSLIKHFMNFYMASGFKKVFLDVHDSNVRAKKLYDSLGFQTLKYHKYGVLTKWLGFTGLYHMAKEINISPNNDFERDDAM